jgi:hypothetical protein
VSSFKAQLSARERTLRVVRVTTDDGKVVSGVKFPYEILSQLKARIRDFQIQKETMAGYMKLVEASGLSTSQMQYCVEDPTPVVPKCVKSASTPQPTMKSFFAAKPSITESSITSSSSLPSVSSENTSIDHATPLPSDATKAISDGADRSVPKRNLSMMETSSSSAVNKVSKVNKTAGGARSIQSFFQPKPKLPPQPPAVLAQESPAQDDDNDDLIDLTA